MKEFEPHQNLLAQLSQERQAVEDLKNRVAEQHVLLEKIRDERLALEEEPAKTAPLRLEFTQVSVMGTCCSGPRYEYHAPCTSKKEIYGKLIGAGEVLLGSYPCPAETKAVEEFHQWVENNPDKEWF